MEGAHWSRGCGTGIGQSHHKNGFRLGVNVNNWVEDRQGVEDELSNKHVFGYKGDFNGVTTQRASYTPDGKFGKDLLDRYVREDAGRFGECTGKDSMFPHGDPYEPPLECNATLNRLTYAEGKDVNRVEDCLWSGSNLNNRKVPLGLEMSSIVSTKRDQWAGHQDSSPLLTSSLHSLLPAAVASAGVDMRPPMHRPPQGED